MATRKLSNKSPAMISSVRSPSIPVIPGKKTPSNLFHNQMLCFRHITRLLARIDYIGSVDKMANKAELRFSIHGLGKVGRD